MNIYIGLFKLNMANMGSDVIILSHVAFSLGICQGYGVAELLFSLVRQSLLDTTDL